MSQPQRHSPPFDAPNPANHTERLAQADRVIERELRKQQRQAIVERRKVKIIGGYRRRKGDR